MTLLGGAIMLASLAPYSWLFGVVLVMIGLLTLQFLTGANSLVQMTSAPAVRGRVMSVYILVLLGDRPSADPRWAG